MIIGKSERIRSQVKAQMAPIVEMLDNQPKDRVELSASSPGVQSSHYLSAEAQKGAFGPIFTSSDYHTTGWENWRTGRNYQSERRLRYQEDLTTRNYLRIDSHVSWLGNQRFTAHWVCEDKSTGHLTRKSAKGEVELFKLCGEWSKLAVHVSAATPSYSTR
ncbi:MAG: hypothetical protein U0931_30125 [Vulcanimicrobiota bacterium]